MVGSWLRRKGIRPTVRQHSALGHLVGPHAVSGRTAAKSLNSELRRMGLPADYKPDTIVNPWSHAGVMSHEAGHIANFHDKKRLLNFFMRNDGKADASLLGLQTISRGVLPKWSPIAGIGLAALGSKEMGRYAWALPLLGAAPLVGEEGLASLRGLNEIRRTRGMGAALAASPALGKALLTYASLPAGMSLAAYLVNRWKSDPRSVSDKVREDKKKAKRRNKQRREASALQEKTAAPALRKWLLKANPAQLTRFAERLGIGGAVKERMSQKDTGPPKNSGGYGYEKMPDMEVHDRSNVRPLIYDWFKRVSKAKEDPLLERQEMLKTYDPLTAKKKIDALPPVNNALITPTRLKGKLEEYRAGLPVNGKSLSPRELKSVRRAFERMARAGRREVGKPISRTAFSEEMEAANRARSQRQLKSYIASDRATKGRSSLPDPPSVLDGVSSLGRFFYLSNPFEEKVIGKTVPLTSLPVNPSAFAYRVLTERRHDSDPKQSGLVEGNRYIPGKNVTTALPTAPGATPNTDSAYFSHDPRISANYGYSPRAGTGMRFPRLIRSRLADLTPIHEGKRWLGMPEALADAPDPALLQRRASERSRAGAPLYETVVRADKPLTIDQLFRLKMTNKSRPVVVPSLLADRLDTLSDVDSTKIMAQPILSRLATDADRLRRVNNIRRTWGEAPLSD